MLDEPLVHQEEQGGSTRLPLASSLARVAALTAAALGAASAISAVAAAAGDGAAGPAALRGAAAIGLAAEDPLSTYVAWWKQHGAGVVDVGGPVLMLVFLMSGLENGIFGFIGIARAMQYPMPAFVGCMGALFNTGGAVMVLVGLFISDALLVIAGAKMVVIFLIFASYSGHYKPLSSAEGQEKVKHQQSLANNVSLGGCLVMLIGHEIMQLSPSAPLIGPVVAFYLPLAPGISTVGRFLMVFPFVSAGAKLGVAGFTGVARHFGFPLPAISGLLAFLFSQLGSSLVMLSPFLPSRWAIGPFNAQAVTAIAGAKMLIIFLIIASYSGHFRPMVTSEGPEQRHHMLSLAKNVSIIGGMLIIIGVDLPRV
eukprot:CAMPEP_0177162826 /NCGR_PEP_ID=MMETSP0367-20130122/6087_1 /TAXON_ID=447022 ORGANISM="Scrippsiella hangoei-like, Strain SHHI-4" /NCGR_SAMPLE_ID=MMETSP0367 /ASSEMBLY_ACC=CAM_ASM_000362 /LENGTH=367 /DNA_ID=CAMNT_0018608613 /DNA_START=40 /DNA_END=1144 /DNA_ORIENTATION=-